MKLLRAGITALALAVAAPLLTTVPATATTDPIDPIARASLQAALAASPAAVDERGGKVVERWLTAGGSTLMRSVHESDTAGHSRLRIGGREVDLRTDVYSDGARAIAAYVPRVIRVALARHGLAHPATWYVPGAESSEVRIGLLVAGDVFSVDPIGDLSDHLVGLSATTEGASTNYTATVRLNRRATETITVAASGGLVDSISAARVSLRYRYGHSPITAPAASREHRALIEAELRLATLARGSARVMHGLRRVGKATRMMMLEQLLTSQIHVVDKRIRLRKMPDGVELTRTVGSWRHPLTWRVRIDGRSVTARPVRTT